ncbi:DUF3775 domain-containing protein [Acetobacteraceae bacterium H6797]|nr:DUF3775 domain-containing protein [Acetobacteraceae bacterium H6797]
MAPSDDENEIDLGISLETVATVIDHARAVQATADEIEETGDEDEEEPDGSDIDMDEETLAAFIDELNEDEQAALIALAWVGRGDFDAEGWDDALAQALERNAGKSASKYLLGMDMVGDLIAEGLSEMGIAEEDIER